MRIWATIRRDHQILTQTIKEFPVSVREVDDWGEIIAPLCYDLDLARPVILKKHINELHTFSRAVFKPDDFMEPVCFDRFEVEIFPEEKKKKKQ